MNACASNILLAGASGLVGGLTLRHLLEGPRFEGLVLAPSRREIAIADPRLRVLKTDFMPAQHAADPALSIGRDLPRPLDAFVSCLGTTIKTAGSRAAFMAVDRDLVLSLAHLAFDRGARQAILVSSVGADPQSGNFYLRVKGEAEEALAQIGFGRVDMLQPGLLLGNRAERRPGEALAQGLAPLANRLLRGRFRRYRAIEADAVARAIVRLLELQPPGRFTHAHDAIQALSGRC